MPSRRALIYLAIFIVSCGVAYALFARFVLDGFPFSGDEYSTVLQAQIFARGRLRAPAPAHAELFGVDHVVVDAWIRSKYPPGTAALLSVGVRCGVPWIVTPIEGALALALVWLSAHACFGARAAGVAAVVLAASPLFVFQAASFYSHTAATMWLAAALAALTWWVRSRRPTAMVLCGTAIGCAFLTRPLDAALFGAALLSVGSLRAILLAGAGGAPLLATHFAYQAAVFGSPWTDGYHAYAPTFQAIYGGYEARGQIALAYLADAREAWNHLDIARAFALDWTVPGCVLLAFIGWRASRADAPVAPIRRVVGVFIALSLFVFCFTLAGGDDGARPRYLSTVLLCVAWLSGPGGVTAGSALVGRIGPRATGAMAAAALLMTPIQLRAFLEGRLPAQATREGLFEEATARALRGVVVVRTQFPTRYARNGPFFDGPVLFVSAPAETPAASVAALFPGRLLYEAHECGGDSPVCHHGWSFDAMTGK